MLNDVWVGGGFVCPKCWWQWDLVNLLLLVLMRFSELYSNHLGDVAAESYRPVFRVLDLEKQVQVT